MIDKDEYDSFDGYVDALEARIAELEAEHARLRDAAEKQRALITNYSLAPALPKLLRPLPLRQLHAQILGLGDE